MATRSEEFEVCVGCPVDANVIATKLVKISGQEGLFPYCDACARKVAAAEKKEARGKVARPTSLSSPILLLSKLFSPTRLPQFPPPA